MTRRPSTAPISLAHTVPRAGGVFPVGFMKNKAAHRWLFGTWRSDRTPTVKEWHFTKRLTPKRRRKVLDIFGHLRITYTRTRIRGVLRDYRFTTRYEVLATDSDTVAIRYEDAQLTGEWRIQHIHFEGRDRYWIALRRNREWFRRVRAA